MIDKISKSVFHLICFLILVVSSLVGELYGAVIRWVVGVIKTIGGIEFETERRFTEVKNREAEETDIKFSEKHFVDETQTLASSTFPISPEDLIKKARSVVRTNFGCTSPELLDDEFLFVFPVVGPLSKAEFIQAFSDFKIDDAFSGSYNYFGFSVDPTEPNRVWFFTRGDLTHTGVLMFGPQKMKPSHKRVLVTPQVLSLTFNRSGLATKLTGGYAVDRSAGNTDGLGGVFGIVHALGGKLPFPEGRPWVPSMRWEAFTNHMGALVKLWKKN